MYVRLLGAAAGGGFPQWNCNCANCRSVRACEYGALPRTQSCVALSGDGRRWFLLNASPDIGQQIEAFPALLPTADAARGTGIQGVLITNADLDHTLGLFILREDHRLHIHATPTVRRTLSQGLRLDAVLSRYGGIDWHDLPPALAPLRYADGTDSGLLYEAFPLPGKPPRYFEAEEAEYRAASSAQSDSGAEDQHEAGSSSGEATGHCVGFLFVDAATGGRLVFMPDVAAFNAAAQARLRDCDALLLDGTFWSENEMQLMGVGTTPAARMGHLPVGGPEGSLTRIAPLTIARKIYLHINNTNPMLLSNTPERAQVESAGCEIGYDGLEFIL